MLSTSSLQLPVMVFPAAQPNRSIKSLLKNVPCLFKKDQTVLQMDFGRIYNKPQEKPHTFQHIAVVLWQKRSLIPVPRQFVIRERGTDGDYFWIRFFEDGKTAALVRLQMGDQNVSEWSAVQNCFDLRQNFSACCIVPAAMRIGSSASSRY